MRRLRYSYLSVLVLLAVWVHDIPAGAKELVIDSDMQYEYARKLFSEKDYQTAMMEYKRFIHFFPESERIDQAQMNIALCLFHLERFRHAARAFDRIIRQNADDKITEKAVFYQSRTFMRLGNSGYAKLVLRNYLKLVTRVELKDKIYFSLARIHLAEAEKSKKGALELAEKALLKISKAGAAEHETDRYLALIEKAENAPKKKPLLAGAAAVIPGAGFAYCERYQDAFITFLLNSGLIWAAYEAWEDGNKPLAGVIGFVETGFYSGNIYGAVSSAHKHNRAQRLKVLNQKVSIGPLIQPAGKRYGIALLLEF